MSQLSPEPIQGSLAAECTGLEDAVLFPRETSAVLRRLRLSIVRLFDAAHGTARKSNDAQKLFGVNAKLSWQIFKLIGPGDTFSHAPHIPSAASMRRLFDAAAERGVPATAIDEVRAAYEAFEQLVIRHAGDRTSFDSMTRGLSEGGEQAQRADIQHRKAMFQGHSHYWGAQLETFLLSFFVCPGSTPDLSDCAHIRSKLGMRRLRPDADVLVDMAQMTDTGEMTFHGETFDAEAARKYGAPLMLDFCTRPLPQLATTQRADGSTWTKLAGDAVGRRGSVDLVFGQIWRDVPLSEPGVEDQKGFATSVQLPYPTATLIVDVFVHRAAFPRLREHFGIYGANTLVEDPMTFIRSQPRLPFRENLARLGPAPDNAHLREIPSYMDLLQRCCPRLNWQLDDFDLYRVHIQYPIFGTLAAIWFDVT